MNKYIKTSQRADLNTKLKSFIVNGDCWEYCGCTNNFGYPLIMVNKKLKYAHRLSYELNIGKIPDGMTIHHTCFNRKCINPLHLQLLPFKENCKIHRKSQIKNWCEKHNCERIKVKNWKNRKTFCPKCQIEYQNKYRKKIKLNNHYITI